MTRQSSSFSRAQTEGMVQNFPDIWSSLNWPIVHSHLNTILQFCPFISRQLIADSSNFNFHSVFMWAAKSASGQVLSPVKEHATVKLVRRSGGSMARRAVSL